MKSSLLASTLAALIAFLLTALHPSSVAAATASISPPKSITERERKHLRTRHSSPPPRLLASKELLYLNDFEIPNSPLNYNDGCGDVYDSSA